MLDQLKKYPDWDYISTDANASAEKQNVEIETLISRGVNALPTVGYDIQIEEPGIFYLSFDNAEVGRIQARGVVDIVNKGRLPTSRAARLWRSPNSCGADRSRS